MELECSQVKTFYLNKKENIICNTDGSFLNKEECTKLINVLTNQCKLDQGMLKTQRKYIDFKEQYDYLISNVILKDTGKVYFMQLENGLIKIGCSSNATKRKKALKSEFGHLNLLFTIESENMYYLESIIHFIFAKYRVERELFNLKDFDINNLKGELLKLFSKAFTKVDIFNFMNKHDLNIDIEESGIPILI